MLSAPRVVDALKKRIVVAIEKPRKIEKPFLVPEAVLGCVRASL
jgi:hypothetical protein